MSAILLALMMWSAQAASVDGATPPLELSIEDAVEIALDQSFQLQRSRRSQRIQDARADATRAGLGPRIDLSIGADQAQRYYDFRGPFDYSLAAPQFSAELGANASYDFDISGARRRSLRQARLSQQTGSIAVAETALYIAIDARLAYIQALRAQQQVEIDQEFLSLIDGLAERAKTRQPGVFSFLGTERANAALVLDQSRQSAELAVSSLRQQLRLRDDRSIRLISKLEDAKPVPTAAELLEIAFVNRSDVKQSEVRREQARVAQAQATDFRRPSLRVSAFASQNLTGETFIPNRDKLGRARSAGVSLSFHVPIWTYDGGELTATKRIAAIQAEQAQADAEEARERARNEITAELIGINRARKRIEQAPDVAAARESLRQAEEQMLSADPGTSPGLLAQVSNARQNWKSSKTLRLDALVNFYSEYFRLQRSIGTENVD